MKMLSTFLLIGVVDSLDDALATVELNMSPPLEESAIAVLPPHAFPCEVKEGDTFYILKLTAEAPPLVMCKKDEEKSQLH